MRFWRSIGLLALALGILSLPAHAADKKKNAKAPKAGQAMAAADTTAAGAAAKTAKSSARKTGARHSHKPVRRSWMLGYSGGDGYADFKGAGRVPFTYPGTYTNLTYYSTPDSSYIINEFDQNRLTPLERTASVLGAFELAYAIRPSLVIGFANHSWSKKISGDTWKFGISAVSAYWYPGGGQFFMSGGFGVGAVTARDNFQHVIRYSKNKLSAPAPPVPIITDRVYARRDDGAGLVASMGYEVSIYRRLALVPEVRAAWLTLTDHVSLVAADASLAARWWF